MKVTRRPFCATCPIHALSALPAHVEPAPFICACVTAAAGRATTAAPTDAATRTRAAAANARARRAWSRTINALSYLARGR